MPGTYTYPGIYVEEVPSAVRTITGVSTAETAFVDFFARGPVGIATRVTSYADFVRRFGGLDRRSEASYGIQQYYLNGGQVSWIVRVNAGSGFGTATINLPDGAANPSLQVDAASSGDWGNHVEVAIRKGTLPDKTFDLYVRETQTVGTTKSVVSSETYRGVSMDPANRRFTPAVVNGASSLVHLSALGAELPDGPARTAAGDPPADSDYKPLLKGGDGDAFNPNGTLKDDAARGSLKAALFATDGTGLSALSAIEPFAFNILCLPAAANLGDAGWKDAVTQAEAYCEAKRAFFIADIPSSITTVAGMVTAATSALPRSSNAAAYFPRVTVPDPLADGGTRNAGASGTLAGIYAATDAARGVWKAPAGTDASLRNVSLALTVTDLDHGSLNPLGINVLRNFPIFGNVSWGARTLNGSDQQASQWKYIPVRRTALFIEQSLVQGLRWVVFEPNDEPLWSQIRLNVGAFMHDLFRQGAFQGNSPRIAYFVKCDAETTTQNDIDRGIVNIVVGFAPLKPAEFVIIKIQQIAGQIQT